MSQKTARSSFFASVPRFVRGAAQINPRLLAAAACVVFAGASSAAGGADGTAQHRRVGRSAGVTLAQRTHESLLDLYSLDAKLNAAAARLDELRAEVAHVRAQRVSVRRRMHAAEVTVRVSQRQLALRLRALYEQTETDPLAAVLGASSLDEAATTLDELDRGAQLDQRITRQAKQARTALARLSKALAARDARLDAVAAAAERTVAALHAQRAARSAYIAKLHAEQRLNAVQVVRIGRRATAAAARAETIAPPTTAATTTAAPTVAAPAAGATLTVVATGYSMVGTTSTGVPTGWGVAAVDPALIPLGTHMSVPGYGDAVAADTGSAVRGAVIDLWFPSEAQALAWGRRTVSITLQ